MKIGLLGIIALTAITLVPPAIAQVVSGTQGKNEGVPAPIGTKAGDPKNTEAAARSALASRKNHRDYKRGSLGNSDGSVPANGQ